MKGCNKSGKKSRRLMKNSHKSKMIGSYSIQRNKTAGVGKRRVKPNMRIFSDVNTGVKVYVTTKTARTIIKYGGLTEFLKQMKSKVLSPFARKKKNQLAQ